MACTCDYSYICPECQDRIETERRLLVEEETAKWIVDALVLLARHVGFELPDPPK
jgi:hypothetical protein